MAKIHTYDAQKFGGKKEVALVNKFNIQVDDARTYFVNCIKPRLDRSYKLYMAYNGDRAKEIKRWQSNIFVPYIHSVVETLMPRILDARPEFVVQGRTEDDQLKADKLNNLCDYTWEKAKMDDTSEMVTRSSLVYGSGYIQAYWKRDEREHSFLKSKNIDKKKLQWDKKSKVFYDGPYAEWVDNYGLWYDWHNVQRDQKQYWFKRLVITGAEIRRRYPGAEKKRVDSALDSGGGDLQDFASIRNEIKLTQDKITKGADYSNPFGSISGERYMDNIDPDLKFHEVFEWWRPFDDSYSVMVNNVPILKGAEMPMPYDFKEAPFIDIPYLKLPNEFEGYGLPMILENPQIMLNMIKNQRLDAMSLNIHKMWIVNPLANIDKKDLVTRPFGIIYSTDPAGVREVQFSDIKASAYKEEELLKSDMRYASGVDDFSMGGGGNAGSATEVRHLRESTLERVRLFINHMGSGYADLMRFWLDMWRQFSTKNMTIRIIGDDGLEQFPLIEKDDLKGEFDYKAMVVPSIAGKNDIDKKQGMDLFQLLINLPFIDPRKLTSKVLHSWNWSLDSVSKQEEGQGLQEGMPGAEGEGQPPEMTPEMMAEMQAQVGVPQARQKMPKINGGAIPPGAAKSVLAALSSGGQEGFAEASNPINLLKSGSLPPTVKGVGKTTNPRGLNRTGKVNTNIPLKKNYSQGSNELGKAANIQR